MKAVLALFFASIAVAAVIDAGLLASRDNFLRNLRSITASSVVVQRDDNDAALEVFSLNKKGEKDDLATRNVGAIKPLGESVPLQARDDTAGGGENSDNGMGNGKKNNGKSDGKATDGKKNNGKADGKATDGKKNNGKSDGKATDGKKNNGKSDGKATDGKKNNNGTADDGGKGKANGGKKGKGDGDSGKKDNSSSGASGAAATAAA